MRSKNYRSHLAVYGLTPEAYTEMLERQEGVCAVCRKPPGRRRLNVDHNHATGAVRGLLCPSCNRGIGLLGDDLDRLMDAVAYLREQA